MAASPTSIPDHLFSEALWLAEGVMILGKSTSEGWWTAGVSSQKKQRVLCDQFPSNQRNYTASAHTNTHSWEERMELYQIKFLLEWMVVEKHIVLRHGIIECYVLNDFVPVFILSLPHQRCNFSVFLHLPSIMVKNTYSQNLIHLYLHSASVAYQLCDFWYIF